MWVSLRELIEVLGKDVATKLCRIKGGTIIYVPKTARDDAPLVPFLGWGGYRALCLEYGGERIMIPNGNKTEPCKEQVLAMLDKGGMSRHEIAQACAVTVRYVYMLAQLSPDARRATLSPRPRPGLQQLSLPL